MWPAACYWGAVAPAAACVLGLCGRCVLSGDMQARRPTRPVPAASVFDLVTCRAKAQPYIASMGIYVCKASTLQDLLEKRFRCGRLLCPPWPRVFSCVLLTLRR